jgi:hypothetical protein
MGWLLPRVERRARGQTFVIVALAMLVLVGFAGLAIDGGHVYLVRRQAQNATDAAALAAGRALVVTGALLAGPPPGGSNGDAVKAAHHLAVANGFSTILSTGCDQGTGTAQFSATWFDTGAPCSATDGFNTRVSVYSPPQAPAPSDCQSAPYNCIQVVIQQRVPSFLIGVLGMPYMTTTTSAVVFAQPAGPLIGTPPPTALYLYEPPSPACSGPQCFDNTKAPGRARLSCDEAGENCPTFWARPGSDPLIAGVDGMLVNGKPNPVAMESAGDMVMQADTTVCNPTGGGTCAAGTPTGTNGYAVGPGGKLFCSQAVGTSVPPGCTQAPQTGLARIIGNQVPFYSQLWTPVAPPATKPCGALILNGQSLVSAGAACVNTSEPYTIQPGQYSSIVINHGIYQFESGYYLITGTAPTSGAIDHSLETAVDDWDLCPGVLGTGPCSAKAGIWIGHGSGPFGPYVAPTPGLCTAFSSPGGGGDATIVSGTGVTFRFGPGSGSFVSTHEVASISLSAPALGSTLTTTGGAPLLFDLENKGFIHLDSAPWDSSVAASPSGFTGIVYQNPNNNAGGVELNPGLGSGSPALTGQVLAYSFTTFGQPGPAIDFRTGWGTAAAPPPVTAGNAESEIFNGITYDPNYLSSGKARIQVMYKDEWALDAYNAYVKVNSNAPVFFSQGIWTNPNSGILPPPGNVPGDNYPANPGSEGNGQYTKVATSPVPDWIYLFNNDGSGRTFEVAGNWTWGHEQSIPGAHTKPAQGNRATLTYMFPSPTGSTVDVTVFMSDGDSCGDYVTTTVSFNNSGSPNAGQQSAGSVALIR